MANQEFVEALNDCIDRLTEGQNIEDCTQQYPQFAHRLDSMLQTGVLVRRATANQVEVHNAQQSVRLRLQQHQRRKQADNRFRRILATGAIAASIVVGLITMTAQNALPGDGLYSIKLFSENVRGGLDPAYGSGPLSEQRRLKEIQRLLALRRTAEVNFEGAVQMQNGTAWRIADVDVQVSPSISSVAVALGDQVAVRGTTTATGILIAQEITLLVAQPQPTASNTPTFTITPSPTPTSTRLPAKPVITIQPTKAAPLLPVTKSPTPSPSNVQPTASPHDNSPETSRPASTPSGNPGEDHSSGNNKPPDS
ncbi:MAG: hypothetical protein ABI947_07375 [Chloroflexota bacterium]